MYQGIGRLEFTICLSRALLHFVDAYKKMCNRWQGSAPFLFFFLTKVKYKSSIESMQCIIFKKLLKHKEQRLWKLLMASERCKVCTTHHQERVFVEGDGLNPQSHS